LRKGVWKIKLLAFQGCPEWIGRITGFAERREAWDLIWTRLP
jgi:hypothetical protein